MVYDAAVFRHEPISMSDPSGAALHGSPPSSEAVDTSRRGFLVQATSAAGALGAAFAAVPFIASWSPSERARALGAPVEPDMVSRLPGHDGQLKDPGSKESEQPAYAVNTQRAVREDFLVVIGNCTHLGCLPKARFEQAQPELGADWPGGFFCPCHGSRFDLAGRVFQGSPASVNLRIPPYSFSGDSTLVIGKDDIAQGAA